MSADRDYSGQSKPLGPDNAILISIYRIRQVKSCVVEVHKALGDGLKQWNYTWAKGANLEAHETSEWPLRHRTIKHQ